MNNDLIIHTDGGARGNPGPAAIGVVIKKSGKLIHEFGLTIGESTNNVAEYRAVAEALKWLKQYCVTPACRQGRCHVDPCLRRDDMFHVTFYLDSLLVVNQLNGLFKIKDQKLRELNFNIKILEQEVGGEILYHAISRTENKRADFLVNQALDDSNK